MEAKSNTSSLFSLFGLLIFISVTLLFLDKFSQLFWLRATCERAANPAKQIFFQSSRIFFKQNTDAGQDPLIIQAKIDWLTAENARLQLEIANIKLENEALKKQLNVQIPNSGSQIIAKNLGVLAGVMTVDKGQNDGVEKDMPVVATSVLVGKVESMSALSAKVSLPTRESNKIAVKILPSGDKGILSGSAEGRLILNEILQKVDLKVDQLVVTSGEKGEYPADLVIGKIKSVIKDDVAIYKRAEVAPLVDYQNLAVVFLQE